MLKNFLMSMTHHRVNAGMESLKTPFKGAKKDLRGRAVYYKDDWTTGLYSGAG